MKFRAKRSGSVQSYNLPFVWQQFNGCDAWPAFDCLPGNGQPMQLIAVREHCSPFNPREFFNAGTRELTAGKFREAEAFLEAALASQTSVLQTPALYNLGTWI